MTDVKAEPSAAMRLAASESGTLYRMGEIFSCDGKRWEGVVWASTLAIYLIKGKAYQGSGIIGLASKLADAMDGSTGRWSCGVYQLPQNLRAVLDPGDVFAACPVVIIPRETVGMIRCSKWNNAIDVFVGEEVFAIETPFFQLRAIPRRMELIGWKFNTALTPTAGASLGLGGEKPGGGSLAIRIIIIAAVVIVIALVKAMLR